MMGHVQAKETKKQGGTIGSVPPWLRRVVMRGLSVYLFAINCCCNAVGILSFILSLV